MIDTIEQATAFAPILDRLSKLLPRLASDQHGEVMATAAAIGRTLAAAKLDWHDLTARLTAENLDDMIAAAARKPWPPEPAPDPKPAPPSWSPEREPESQAAQKPKKEPSPWPTWSMLSHFSRLAVFDELKKGNQFTAEQAEAFAKFHKVYYREQCGAHRKAINLFNRGCRDLYERGFRWKHAA